MRGLRILLLALTLALGASGAARADTLTLARALELGRKHAPELREARANARSEDAQSHIARAPYYPTLGAQLLGQSSATRATQPLPPPRTGVFTYTQNAIAAQGALNAQWMLYDFGRTSNNVRNADAQLASALATVGATDLLVEANVANAYVNLAYAVVLRDVAQATVRQREKLVTLAKALVKAGLQPPLEEIRASARAESARSDLATAEAAVLDARAVLAMLLGLDLDDELAVEVPHFPRLGATTEGAMRDADRLPTVVAAEETANSKRAIADVAQSQYLPSIGLSVSGAYAVARFDSAADAQTTANGIAGISLSVPIFDASLGPTLDATRANADNAQATADQAQRDAREEAARALAAVRSSAAIMEHARKAADAAAGVLTVVQARYVQGLSSPLELIDAETAESTARTLAAQADMTHALAVVRFLVATGRKVEEAS